MASHRILILASASPRRADLLREAGIPFKVFPSQVKEHTLETSPHRSPRFLAIHNAELKAKAAARRFPGHWVLGADTIVVLGRKLFGKPSGMREAAIMLGALSGRTHRVITGVCFVRKGFRPQSFAVATRVTFKELTSRQIQNYLKQIQPLDKAGAYAAQSRPHSIIRKIEGSFTNVVGLPMERTLREWTRLTCRDSSK